MRGSGDGFVQVADGSVRWGIYGAAGVLFRHVGDDEVTRYFVALRSDWTHLGGTWAVPGGALDIGEGALEGALREFHEEIGALPRAMEVADVHIDDHGGWTYTTVVVDVPERFVAPEYLHWETAGVAWATAAELRSLPLFPDFRVALTKLGVLDH